MARVVILLLVCVVFLGYLLLWIMAPTDLYAEEWEPTIRDDTESTFFGLQGSVILLYTFPMLFIAVLGCLYLYLGKKYNSPNIGSNVKRHSRMAVWKRPMILRGLGIVTRIELAFFAMFIALLVWSLSSYLGVSFSDITSESAAMEGETVGEARLESAALTLGMVGNIVLAFLFYPVARGSSVLPLLGLTSEASIKYHIWLGHIAMVLFTAHGLCYIIFWAVTDNLSQMVKWAKTGVSNLAGELALVSGLVLWVTTLPRIRRKMFELFFYTHYLYILFVVFFVLHVGIAYSCIMLPSFYLFMVDRFLRFLQSQSTACLISARILPGESFELNFAKSKGLSYTPTSIMFINVPSISRLQWHPFTISSSSGLEPERLSVIIKGEGSWTKKLYQMISSPSSSAGHIDISIEGPYGPASTDFLRHDTLVMVSGGSGITPFISIIKELIFMNQTLKLNTPKIILVSSFRNSSDVAMVDLLLPLLSAPSLISALDIQIHAYVTREKEPKDRSLNPIQTKWFNPNPKHQPISPILGRNSWMWLGLIISSSFVIFLLFMGILTRYYIYPIDHNTNEKFSYAAKALLNMLLICASIAITASAAFYWNKRNNQRKLSPIENTNATTLVSSSRPQSYNADQELESLPLESIVQSTTVHYGERPDLKRILFEQKASSVGVLVCGSKKMRNEVARICSSGLADNLQFESISFSW